MENEDLLKFETIMYRNAENFLNSIKSETAIISRRVRTGRPKYQVLKGTDPNYTEQKYYEDIIDYMISKHLIYQTLLDLLTLQTERKADFTFVYRQRKITYVRGKKQPYVDLIISKGNKRIGYYFSDPGWDELQVYKILRKLVLNHVEEIQWEMNSNDLRSINYSKRKYYSFCYYIKLRINKAIYRLQNYILQLERENIYYDISIQHFMKEYFTDEIYEKYIEVCREVIEKANDLIGYQTISKNSSRHLYNFKIKEIEYFSGFEKIINNITYQKFSGKGKRTDFTIEPLSENDMKVVTNYFLNKHLFKALTGSESFARCFMTSEYMYEVFKTGEESYFDYTAIATGYLKSIELLLYKIMKATLLMDGHSKLQITCKKFIKDERIDNKKYFRRERINRNGKTTKYTYIRFEEQYENEFNIEMGSLICFIEDNVNGWHDISKEGKEIIMECLKNYNYGCRNQHFHKDIIEDKQTINSLRNNTLLCLIYLIGACKFSDNEENYEEILGIADDTYNRLYRKLKSIWMTNYYLQLPDSDDLIKAIRIMHDEHLEADEFDSQGNIISPIRFIKVNDFSDYSFDTDEEYIRFIESQRGTDKEILICKENIPLRIWYVNMNKQEEIFW